jgi:predicted metal-binding protein
MPLGKVPGRRNRGETHFASRETCQRQDDRRTGVSAADRVQRTLSPRPIGKTKMGATLHVCISCKGSQPVPEGQACLGAQLYAALAPQRIPGVTIKPAECLSACDHGPNIALSGGPARWSYAYRGMGLDDVADIVAGATAYSATPDGLIPWRERPIPLRKRVLARIPPMEP